MLVCPCLCGKKDDSFLLYSYVCRPLRWVGGGIDANKVSMIVRFVYKIFRDSEKNVSGEYEKSCVVYMFCLLLIFN